MITKKLIFIATPISVLLLVIGITAYKNTLFHTNTGKSLGVSVTSENLKQNPVHQVKFFDEQAFNEGVNKAKNNKPFTNHITGGIIPHHLLVSFVIADFFSKLSAQKPATIILLGPNHYEKGNFKALTSLYDWDTSFGLVHPDNSTINSLINSNLVKVDEETLPNDQALSTIMPFIKYYLPDTKVVPILISGALTKDESEVLANKLSSFVTKDVIVVSSVDFSHYLTSSQAKEKDKITLQVIKEFNYRQLYLLNSEYLDSPPSIGVLLMIMRKLGTAQMDLLYNSNSGEIQQDNFIQITSYFEVAYH